VIKVYFPNESKQSLGGGFTFFNTIIQYFSKQKDVEVVFNSDQADVVFICGATLIKGDQLAAWKAQGKKIILRVDNVPKDSRNRGCGFSRLRKCAEAADIVIYQSQWAKNYTMPLTKKDGPVIYNGCDQSIFYPSKDSKPNFDIYYLFANYNRDENKRFPEAAYHFSQLYKQDNERKLRIVGNFSPEMVQYNFDFFNGEKIEYYGVVDSREQMADIMRKSQVLLFPAYADACPQTVIEAISCGLKIELVSRVGGTMELINMPREYFNVERMGAEYINTIKGLFR
jgi:glycosyltransferase involved in cell wall biosynthesis